MKTASIFLLAAMIFSSCALLDEPVAVVKTDIPEIALYADAFNSSQERYKIHVEYDRNLAEYLLASGEQPTLAIGRYLNSSSTRQLFYDMDSFLDKLDIEKSAFYQELLDSGKFNNKQLLIPLSFNLPLIVFGTEMESKISNNFFLELQELEQLAKDRNKENKGSWTNLGFGPRWEPNFLFYLSVLKGASFQEDSPLDWDGDALGQAIMYSKLWSERANGSTLKEDEFQFKYLYLPVIKSVEEGRIAFACMDSAEYFVIPEERRSVLSFRWLSGDSKIPLGDKTVYAGVLKKSRGKPAAMAFLKWLLSEETQKGILEDARQFRTSEQSFGIAQGFSSIRAFNEKLFPVYYPSLLGRLPPARSMVSSGILPYYWPEIKKELLLPFLLEATGDGYASVTSDLLKERLLLWYKHFRTK